MISLIKWSTYGINSFHFNHQYPIDHFHYLLFQNRILRFLTRCESQYPSPQPTKLTLQVPNTQFILNNPCMGLWFQRECLEESVLGAPVQLTHHLTHYLFQKIVY
jgi:hypothetical protein